jgi:superoxide reductase
MTNKLEVYRCSLCGNIVEVIHASTGELVCCGEPMRLLKENSTDAAQEKHVPVVEKTGTGYKVSVGSTLHPMETDHYIEWIELVADGRSCIQFLQPGDAPEAEFDVKATTITAKEYCNKHGFWKGK